MFYIIEEITSDLIRSVNEYYLLDKPEYMFYINSPGGSVFDAEVLLDIFNFYKNKTTLIANGQVSSVAFNLFFRAQCNRIIYPNSYGIAHRCYWVSGSIRKEGAINEIDKWILEKHDESVIIDLMKSLKFTKRELKDFIEGKDIKIGYKRLIKMLKIQEK